LQAKRVEGAKTPAVQDDLDSTKKSDLQPRRGFATDPARVTRHVAPLVLVSVETELDRARILTWSRRAEDASKRFPRGCPAAYEILVLLGLLGKQSSRQVIAEAVPFAAFDSAYYPRNTAKPS
jgi:hypothetical protein